MLSMWYVRSHKLWVRKSVFSNHFILTVYYFFHLFQFYYRMYCNCTPTLRAIYIRPHIRQHSHEAICLDNLLNHTTREPSLENDSSCLLDQQLIGHWSARWLNNYKDWLLVLKVNFFWTRPSQGRSTTTLKYYCYWDPRWRMLKWCSWLTATFLKIRSVLSKVVTSAIRWYDCGRQLSVCQYWPCKIVQVTPSSLRRL